MDFHSEKEKSEKRLLSQLYESLDDFVNSGNNQTNVTENETVRTQNYDFFWQFWECSTR